MTFRIAVIGDLHTHWDEVDVVQFNDSDYDLLLFTGDLGGGTPESSLRMARTMSRLEKPTLVMPGNHDTGDIAQLAAELSHQSGMRRLAAIRAGTAGAPPPIRLCGYSTHPIGHDELDVTLIAGRPHSLGGPELAYPEHMASCYGIDSVHGSGQRLCDLVDQTPSRRLLFLSHNGPTGLGEAPDDMWGCDFEDEGGDWGDPDLALAVEHAVTQGREVLAVVAGHMHLRTRCNRERPWTREHRGIRYVNAARVPRIRVEDGATRRHHIALTLSPDGVAISEVLVPETAPDEMPC